MSNTTILTIVLIVIYIIIELNRPYKLRIVKKIINQDPLKYGYYIQLREQVLRYWVDKLKQKNSGEIVGSSNIYLCFNTLEEAQKCLDKYSIWLKQGKEIINVDYIINKKDKTE